MEFFGRKRTDPLLFDCDDRNELDSLMGDRSDNFKLDSSGLGVDLDMDTLDPNSDLGWLHNSSLSHLTSTLDAENDGSLSDGNLFSVNPETVMPMQLPHNPHQQPVSQERDDSSDIDIANSAAMRLHANCSDVNSVAKTVLVQQQPTQHIQLVAVPVAATAVSVSNSSTPVHSPMKASTIVLDSSNTFSVAGTTYIASPQKVLSVTSGQKTRNVLTPSQCSPVLVGHLQSGVNLGHPRPITVTLSSPLKCANIVTHHQHSPSPKTVSETIIKQEEKVYPKPVYSYSCLIALALKNSKSGNLPVSEIYNFMVENFPYFKSAPDGWKNSVRHNLSLNKCFAKVDNPKLSSGAKKGCLWALNPAKIKKMEEEICKWSKKDPVTLLNSMAYPENLQAIEKGQAGLPTRKDDENYQTPPSSPIKDATAAIARHYDELEHIKEEPLESYDLELMNELAAHGHHWSTESGDLHIDLISNSSIVSSPVTVQSSPAPHTPSHSGSLTSV
ncbi:forkhead box protein N4-like isoform X2 [Pomacea canaliculata]|uniref:forkhead box protein N4-like isoform X2 n=1 Tax=Pomacea canaliculata TaxID=400727 RepID=UPI000D73CB96|nr:forkhead box protein N4-like isoform X2 [Pomacea canaliculata]